MQYRPAKIYPESLDLSVKKWYVFYYFMHPFTGKYERFKVYEDINLYKDAQKVEYAKNLSDAVTISLKAGYNPYEEAGRVAMWVDETERRAAAAEKEDNRYVTMIEALNMFLTAKKVNGLSDSSLSAYATTANFIRNWLNDDGMLLVPAANITANQFLNLLSNESQKNEWENKTYNNYLLYTETILNWLAKDIRKIIPLNPIKGAEQRTILNNKPSAYTDDELNKILGAVRSMEDTYMEGLILTCYYACVRSKAEMRGLRIRNILWDRELLLLSADETKARREDYIPLDPILKEFYKKQGFHDMPPDWFVFSNNGAAGAVQAAQNFYSRLYRPYREQFSIDESKKLYNWKHTRGIHLANAKVDPYAIMQLFRHTSLEQTQIYLRDLGCAVNFGATENSRKI